jgi:hypothetical protein
MPFLLYRIYVAYVMRHKVDSGGTYNEVPLTLLFIIGLGLSIFSFIILGLTGEEVTGPDYRPATFEDGKIVPPRFEE